MADLPISGLTASASNAAATDVLPVVQTTGTGPVKMTVQQVAGGLLGSTTLSGATVTTSQPVLNLAQTWNASGVTFAGLRFNAAGTSDANSASASLLLDLQVGGSSRFSITKAGSIRGYAADLNINPSDSGYPVNLNSNMLVYGSGGIYQVILNTAALFKIGSDLTLTRRGVANLRFGDSDAAAPVAQTLSVQSVVAGTTNTAGAALTITGSQGTGSGVGGAIIFQVAVAGAAPTVQNTLVTALTIGGDRFIGLNGTTGGFNLETSDGYNSVGLYSTGILIGLFSQRDGLRMGSARQVSWSSNTNPSVATADLLLVRDTTATLALRNGAAAQAFNIYNTYTSSTSFERYSVDWITTANLVIVGPNKGSGGGTQRVQRLSYLEDGGAGSTVPLLGSTCPAVSGTVKSWIKVITSDGTTAYVPCWA